MVFFGILLILAIIVGISYYQIKSVESTYSNLLFGESQQLFMIKGLDNEIKKEQVALRGYLIIGDETSLNNFNQARESFLGISKKLIEMYTASEAQELLKELDAIQREYYLFSEEIFALKREGKIDEYTQLISTRGREIVANFDKKIEELTLYQQGIVGKGSKESTAKVESLVNILLFLGIASILIGAIVAIYISRFISKPVIAIAETAQKISSGDLTVAEVKVKNKDEIGDLAHSFNQMAHNLRAILAQVGSNAELVAASAEQLSASSEQSNHASKQIADTIQSVAGGVEKQVENVERTAQTINEISIGIQHVSKNTQTVSTTAIEATEKAAGGRETIKTAVQQMNSINHTFNELSEVVKGLGARSEEIGQIIAVITGIADQTNLLALNAAIEAARAGEHGRGFAVVADEVRRLAEQSADSAQQISRLISTIQGETNKVIQSMDVATSEVVSGINVVNTAGDSFVQIEKSVNEVTSQIQEVSSAIQQIAAGSEKIVEAIEFISEASEGTAAGTEEVSAATEEQLASMEEISASSNALAKMSEELQKLISNFKTK